MMACRKHYDNVQHTKCGLPSGPKGKLTLSVSIMFMSEIIQHKKWPSCQVNSTTLRGLALAARVPSSSKEYCAPDKAKTRAYYSCCVEPCESFTSEMIEHKVLPGHETCSYTERFHSECTLEKHTHPQLAFSILYYHYHLLQMPSQTLTLLSGQPPLLFPRQPLQLLTACEIFYS